MAIVNFLINTYQRTDMVMRLVDQINETQYHKLIIHINNDGGDKLPKKPNTIMCNHKHHGREKYYLLCQNLFWNAEPKADYFFKIDDDMKLVDGFVDKAIEIWNAIPDRHKCGLNLLKDARDEMWGSRDRTRINAWVDYSDWIDLNWMMDRKSFQRLQELYLQPPTEEILKTSSGVGRQVCRHMRRVGNLYQVRKSLLIHGRHESKMNPQRELTGEIL